VLAHDLASTLYPCTSHQHTALWLVSRKLFGRGRLRLGFVTLCCVYFRANGITLNGKGIRTDYRRRRLISIYAYIVINTY
jgi:hypothetical protein